MWTHLDNRSSYLQPPELWHLGNSNEWDIWNFYGAIALCYILPEGLFNSFDKSIFSSISWHTHLVLRYGTANSYKQEVEQENVVWRKNINFCFTGIYIKVGINYNFFKKTG